MKDPFIRSWNWKNGLGGYSPVKTVSKPLRSRIRLLKEGEKPIISITLMSLEVEPRIRETAGNGF